jgi:UPF0755 protein
MRLQSDPTIVYAKFIELNEDEKFISLSDTKYSSLYNTYIHKGLPPTPICNPGYESLKAVFSPLKTNYLFFVSNGSGGHNFSTSYDEHLLNKKLYKKTPTYKILSN